MKNLILLLLLMPLTALALPSSGWYIELDEDRRPADDNSGFNIMLPSAGASFVMAYYTHVENYIGPAIPPTVSPSPPPSPYLLDQSDGQPIWFQMVSNFFVEQDGIAIAAGDVVYFPQDSEGGRVELKVGEFFILGIGNFYELDIEYTPNEVFGETYSLYRDYNLGVLVVPRE